MLVLATVRLVGSDLCLSVRVELLLARTLRIEAVPDEMRIRAIQRTSMGSTTVAAQDANSPQRTCTSKCPFLMELWSGRMSIRCLLYPLNGQNGIQQIKLSDWSVKVRVQVLATHQIVNTYIALCRR
jgi:hypothetical protein